MTRLQRHAGERRALSLFRVAYGAFGIGIQAFHGRYIGRNTKATQFSQNRSHDRGGVRPHRPK